MIRSTIVSFLVFSVRENPWTSTVNTVRIYKNVKMSWKVYRLFQGRVKTFTCCRYQVDAEQVLVIPIQKQLMHPSWWSACKEKVLGLHWSQRGPVTRSCIKKEKEKLAYFLTKYSLLVNSSFFRLGRRNLQKRGPMSGEKIGKISIGFDRILGGKNWRGLILIFFFSEDNSFI